MYKTCPKCGHTRNRDSNTPDDRCPACGLIYKKWFKHRFRIGRHGPGGDRFAASGGSGQRLAEYLLFVNDDSGPLVFYARAAIYILMLVWGWQFMTMDYYYFVESVRIDAATPEIYDSFLHGVNLLFHEAGHLLFSPLGRFMSVLGGSLLQIIIPVVVMLVFLIKQRNTFGAAFGLWWTAQNFMDVAPYINDARNMQIPLLGGGSGADRPGMHDWHNILSQLGMLESDHSLAAVINGMGILLMLLSLLWAAALLYRHYMLLKKR